VHVAIDAEQGDQVVLEFPKDEESKPPTVNRRKDNPELIV
jgi:hypothetical protein